MSAAKTVVCSGCGAYVPEGWSHACTKDESTTWRTDDPKNRTTHMLFKVTT